MGLLTNLFISIFFLLLPLISTKPEISCVYTVYVRTGSIIKGGTDSTISLQIFDAYGEKVEIPNLAAWGGVMGPGHDYYERGSLDIFSGRGNCLNAPMCAVNLTSDGARYGHGWYCNYVEITATRPHSGCSQKLFTVEQWLALDTFPYELTAIRNYCSDYGGGGEGRVRRVKSGYVVSETDKTATV